MSLKQILILITWSNRRVTDRSQTTRSP